MPVSSAVVVWPTSRRTIGCVIAVVLIVGFAVAVFVNMRQGRAEVGSEIELAANRKPYLDDEELETKKLDRTLGLGLVAARRDRRRPAALLARRAGSPERRRRQLRRDLRRRGEALYNEGANCAACHGPEGVGGVATFTVTDRRRVRRRGDWKAPALDTVLFRYTREEVQVHPHLRPRLLARCRRGAPRRRSAHRAAARQHHRLPREHPAPRRRGGQAHATSRSRRPAHPTARVAAPSRSGQPGGARTYATVGEAIFNLGLYDGIRRRRLLVRPLPHEGLVLRRARGVRWRRPRPEPPRRRHAAPVPHRRVARSSSSRPARAAASPTA